jgi:predicted deacylase
MTDPSSRSLIRTDIDYDREGLQHSHLRLPHSHDRSGYGHVPIPIAVLKRGHGPTLLLTGGNHGDEYEGPVALMKLVRRLPRLALRGRLIVIPGLNFPALLNGTRTSPMDGANLNRSFPGRRHGSLTEMIAHYLDSELFPRCDAVLDIHAGGASTDYLPTLLAAPPADRDRRVAYRRLIDAFGAPRVMFMDLLGEDRTFGAAVERHGVHFLCGEFGGHAVCGLDGLQLVEEGIERLMDAMGMLEGAAPPPPRHDSRLLKVEGERHYVFAPVGGIFEPAFRLGDEVVAGQSAGFIHDPRRPAQAPSEVRFEGAGLAVCIRALARVEEGDCLGHLATDATWSS